MTDTWTIVEPAFEVATARAYEGLFTQGSGYLHLRGSLEEHLCDDPQNVTYTRTPANVTSEKLRAGKLKWGAYVPGVFGRHPLLNNEMINLPFFLGLAPYVAGEKLDMEAGRITDYRRELRLDQALLRRRVVWLCRSDAKVEVVFERFVSAAQGHLCVQRMTMSSDRAVEVEIRGGIDADVRTNGYDHFTSVTLRRQGASGLTCDVLTDAQERVTIATELSASAAVWEYDAQARQGTLRAKVQIPAGGQAVVEKRTAVATSRDRDGADAAAMLAGARAESYETLLAAHRAVWRARWESCDVAVEGDDRSQIALRGSLYHVLRAHVSDDRVAIDAKGYAGEAYWGRFFWDTEIYLLPFYLYTDPARARTLVDFRVQSLPGAMANAKAYGYGGARYAWESDSQGNECCPNWQYRDHEIHISADVVYGMSHYARLADPDYLAGPAARVALETGRYWLARMDWRLGEGHPSLLGVMGPDEYAPISSNNAYTNRMVRFALGVGAQAARAAGLQGEAAQFETAAAGLPIPRRADGLVLQCEEYERLAEPRFETLWRDRDRTFAEQVSQERLYRCKAIKQADVLMMMFLFAGEFTDAQVRAAYDYYLPYTTHDSSLSASVHSILSSRLGLREQAWRFWQASSEVDLDVEHGGAANGIHIAAAGANWQVAVLGFAGLATAMETDTLTLRPRLPDAWRKLSFPLIWKGTPVHVEITHAKTTVTNRGSSPMAVRVNKQEKQVPPSAAVAFP